MFMCGFSWILQQDSCGEEERPRLVTVVKPSAKPRRAKLLSKGRKLNNRKRGRPKKAALVAEKKNKKNQSALDLLHAKTLSAAPPQGQHTHEHRKSLYVFRQYASSYLMCVNVVNRCIPVGSESLLPATSQGPALSVKSAAVELNSTCSPTPARWAD